MSTERAVVSAPRPSAKSRWEPGSGEAEPETPEETSDPQGSGESPAPPDPAGGVGHLAARAAGKTITFPFRAAKAILGSEQLVVRGRVEHVDRGEIGGRRWWHVDQLLVLRVQPDPQPALELPEGLEIALRGAKLRGTVFPGDRLVIELKIKRGRPRLCGIVNETNGNPVRVSGRARRSITWTKGG